MATDRISLMALSLVFATFPLSLLAGWEDVAPVRETPTAQERPNVAQQTRWRAEQPATKNVRTVAPSQRTERKGSYGNLVPRSLYSAFLDADDPTASYYDFSYITAAEITDTTAEFSEAVVDASVNIAAFHNLIGGDLKLSFDPRITYFIESGDSEPMPDALLKAALDFNWTWRFVNAWSFELGVAPGIYADIDALGGDMFSFPFRFCFYYAFNPEAAVRFGAEIRPGWDMEFMPMAGIAWRPVDQFRLEVGVPRSLLCIDLGVIDIFGKIEWSNITYAMSGEDGDAEDITINDWKAGGGLCIHFSDTARLTLEAGMALGRSLSATTGSDDNDADVENAPYFGIVFGSKF